MYVVECTGDGIASRALVRIGYLTSTEGMDQRGHVLRVYDEELAPVKDCKVSAGGATYTPDGVCVGSLLH